MKRRQFMASASILLMASAMPVRASQRNMTVHKDPNCGCCGAWADAMKNAGFEVEVRNVDDLAAIKRRFGVPSEMEGCHTASVDGYFLEGHLPLEAVERLLEERPDVAGLAVPGMPNGSLGMGNDLSVASYDVWSVGRDGRTRIFMNVRPRKA